MSDHDPPAVDHRQLAEPSGCAAPAADPVDAGGLASPARLENPESSKSSENPEDPEHPQSPGNSEDAADEAAAALGRLLVTTRGRLRTLFGQAGIDAADAEDILQDSLLIVHRKWETIRDPEGYLFGTVRYRIDLLRRQRAAALMVSLDAGEVERLAPVAAAQEATDRQQDARSLLARLSGKSRRVLELRYGEQLSMREIAAALEESETGVRKTASRAVQRLRQYAKMLKLDKFDKFDKQ